MQMVGEEAYTLAADMIKKDMGFREAAPIPSYEWMIGINELPAGWAMEEEPDLSIYDWNTRVAVYRHALMRESKRTANSVQYSWMWDITHVRCGVYVGVVNFTLGGTAKMVKTGGLVDDRVKIFLKREGDQLTKAHEKVPWR